MQVNGMELEFKITNAKFARKYEQAFEKMRHACEALPDTLAENIRAQCQAVKKLTDTLFGAGVYEQLGLDPDDLDENLDFVDRMIQEAALQKEQALHRYDKYLPNRAARRHGK